MMVVGVPESPCSDTNMKLRLGGRPQSGWKCVAPHSQIKILTLFNQILGFGPNGQPILPSADVNADPDVVRRERLGWEQIVSKSSKIVSFIDLAGHEKYLKVRYFSDTIL